MIAGPVGRRRRSGRRCRRTRSGSRRLTGLIRWSCWSRRTPPAKSDLVPVRHGRMMVSPFTFYRGAAKVMAADLAGTPTAGLTVQLCGDAHLSNFGGFASPERQLLFGLNDFDETLPGPFEYDLKRMAASFTIAARNNGFTPKDTQAVTLESVQAYRLAMAEFAGMRTLDIWYAHMSEHDFQDAMRAVQEEASTAGGTGKRQTWQEEGEGNQGGQGRQRGGRSDRGSDQSGEQDPPEGAHPRQPACADPVRRGRRRPVSDRQPAAGGRAVAGARGSLGAVSRPDPRRGGGSVPRLPEQPQRGSAAVVGEVQHRRHGPQGGRRGQRRHPRVDGVAGGPRQRRPVVPAGEGSHPVGPRGPSAEQPFPHPGSAGGGGATADAGRLRHLPRLDQGGAGRPVLLLAPASRHEGVGDGRDHDTVRDDLLRADLWMDARPRARPLG